MNTSKEKFPNRRHGDGNSKLEASVENDERDSYLQILQRILSATDLNFDLTDTTKVDSTLLAIKQRLAIGFSNGCPWPEKVIIKFIENQKNEIPDLDTFAKLVLESGRSDAQCSVLYQKILKYANQTLRSELQLLKETDVIDGQENDNLPVERTKHNLVAGMAYDPVYFDILLPLQKFIVGTTDQQLAYNKVIKFLIEASYESSNIKELIERTKFFLK